MTTSFESVSAWRQPLPETTSPCRRHLIDGLAEAVDMLSSGRLRVAVDGRTAAGKTTFAHELAAALRRRGRSTARASPDDFTHPWSHAHRHGYDRVTGEGYYRNAYDFTSATNLLLQPAGSSGSGRVALCAHDPLTAADHHDTIEQLPEDTVLIVDSVFAFRPQYAPFWDYRIWLEIESGLALRRGITRDNDKGSGDSCSDTSRASDPGDDGCWHVSRGRDGRLAAHALLLSADRVPARPQRAAGAECSTLPELGCGTLRDPWVHRYPALIGLASPNRRLWSTRGGPCASR